MSRVSTASQRKLWCQGYQHFTTTTDVSIKYLTLQCCIFCICKIKPTYCIFFLEDSIRQIYTKQTKCSNTSYCVKNNFGIKTKMGNISLPTFLRLGLKEPIFSPLVHVMMFIAWNDSAHLL